MLDVCLISAEWELAAVNYLLSPRGRQYRGRFTDDDVRFLCEILDLEGCLDAPDKAEILADCVEYLIRLRLLFSEEEN